MQWQEKHRIQIVDAEGVDAELCLLYKPLFFLLLSHSLIDEFGLEEIKVVQLDSFKCVGSMFDVNFGLRKHTEDYECEIIAIFVSHQMCLKWQCWDVALSYYICFHFHWKNTNQSPFLFAYTEIGSIWMNATAKLHSERLWWIFYLNIDVVSHNRSSFLGNNEFPIIEELISNENIFQITTLCNLQLNYAELWFVKALPKFWAHILYGISSKWLKKQSVWNSFELENFLRVHLIYCYKL